MEKLLDDLEARLDARRLSGGSAAFNGRLADAAIRPDENEPLREPHVRADLPRLPPGMHFSSPSRL